jgi:hypothetical protein
MYGVVWWISRFRWRRDELATVRCDRVGGREGLRVQKETSDEAAI